MDIKKQSFVQLERAKFNLAIYNSLFFKFVYWERYDIEIVEF